MEQLYNAEGRASTAAAAAAAAAGANSRPPPPSTVTRTVRVSPLSYAFNCIDLKKRPPPTLPFE